MEHTCTQPSNGNGNSNSQTPSTKTKPREWEWVCNRTTIFNMFVRFSVSFFLLILSVFSVVLKFRDFIAIHISVIRATFLHQKRHFWNSRVWFFVRSYILTHISKRRKSTLTHIFLCVCSRLSPSHSVVDSARCCCFIRIAVVNKFQEHFVDSIHACVYWFFMLEIFDIVMCIVQVEIEHKFGTKATLLLMKINKNAN